MKTLSWPYLTIIVVVNVLAQIALWVFGQPVIFFVLIAFATGVSIGHILGFEKGRDLRDDVLERQYGEDWHAKLAFGHWYKSKSEEASRN